MSGAAGMFVRGLALGFSIAAPVGPIGVLCIRRTLAAGRLAGFCSGLGAATADASYGAVAALGLTAISRTLTQQQNGLRLIGGVFLLYLGARTALSQPATRAALAGPGGRGLAGMYASTLALTLTNPTTILSFAAVFAGMGFAARSGAGGTLSGTLLVAGVFLGSTLWWFILSSGVSLARQRVTPRTLIWVNRLSGGVLCAFGALALASLAR